MFMLSSRYVVAWSLLSAGLCLSFAATAVALEPPPGDAPPPRDFPLPNDDRPPPPDGHRPMPGDEGPDRPHFGPEAGGAPRDLWARLDAEEKERVLSFIEKEFPILHEELERAREEGDFRFVRRMARVAPEMRRMMEMVEDHPEHGRLFIKERAQDMKFRRITFAYKNARDDEKRTEIRGKLREMAEHMFDVRIARREMEIRDLEQRLGELQSRLAHDKAHREKMIEEDITRHLDNDRPEPPDMLDHPRPGKPDGLGPDGGEGPRPKNRPDRPAKPRDKE